MPDNLSFAPDLATTCDDIDEVLRACEDGAFVEDFVEIPESDTERIYSHGYTVRVDLKTKNPEEALAQIGWAPRSKEWLHSVTKHSKRWILRGSTFITQAAPRNLKLPMTQLNRKWRTRLYAIEYDQSNSGHFLLLRGVRHNDIHHLVRAKMKLEPSEYAISYYLTLERFFVVPPHIALRLASDLGGVPEVGRGRLSRKRWLLRDHPVAMTVRSRSKRIGRLNIYRIGGGATAQYKVEIALKGRRQDRSHFHDTDIPVLDAVLLDLIDRHNVNPVPKPARWEPRTSSRWRRDPRLAVLSAKAYRGSKVREDRVRLAQKCNAPVVSFWAETAVSALTSMDQPIIRKELGLEGAISGSSWSPVWSTVAKDIREYQGYLSEVVLDGDQDPEGLLAALVQGAPEVGVGILAADVDYGDGGCRPDSWMSGSRFALQYPVTETIKMLVVLVDWSVMMGLHDAVEGQVGDRLYDFTRGPLYPAYWQPKWGTLPLLVKGLGACMTPMFDELRSICEVTGLSVVVVTLDCRPDHGRGRLQRSHYFRDGRVKSHVGDAGRYFAHLRYLVESDDEKPVRAVLLKDEGQGLTGRMLWGNPEG